MDNYPQAIVCGIILIIANHGDKRVIVVAPAIAKRLVTIILLSLRLIAEEHAGQCCIIRIVRVRKGQRHHAAQRETGLCVVLEVTHLYA